MLRRGDYVLCNFPFHDSDGPGPFTHVVLCGATGREGGTRFAIVFYTTSQIVYEGVRRPRQYLFVDERRAKALGQSKSFHVDTSRVARLPLTKEYFPSLSGETLPILGSDPDFVTKVEERLRQLLDAGLEIRKVDYIARKRR